MTRTDPASLERLVSAVRMATPGEWSWAVEQTGSYGAGLVSMLSALGEGWWRSIDRPDQLVATAPRMTTFDAVRAAREALSREHLAAPGARGDREAMRSLFGARRAGAPLEGAVYDPIGEPVGARRHVSSSC